MKTYEEKIEAIKNIIACMGESDAVALHNEYCIAREIVDREESFRNDEIQEEIDSWNEENDEENEEEN